MLNKIRAYLASPITWIVLLSLVWTVVFALDLLPILRGGPDWDWHYKPVLDEFRVAPLVVGVVVYVSLGLWLRRRSIAALLAWSVLGGIGLSLAAVHLRGDVLYRLYTITVSGRSEGWHMAAARIQDLAATLHDWPQFMAASLSYSPHIDHTPPGIVLIYYWAGRVLDSLPAISGWLAQPLRWLLCQYLTGYTAGQYASAWLGILMPVWASLTAVPLYRLGQRLFGDETGRWAALWWPLVPGFLIFAPLPNTFYAMPSLLVIGLLWEGLTLDRLLWVAAAGLLMSILTFLTFTFAPLLLFAGLLTLGAFWLKKKRDAAPPHWYWPFRVGLVFGVGLAVVWLVFWGLTGLSFWNLWQTAQQTQVDIAQIRPYLPWLALDLNDLFMFTGWPLALLALIATWSSFKLLVSQGVPSEAAVMTAAAALTLIVIDLYGTPRGEWGRIMVLLSPWLLLAAAGRLSRAPRSASLVTAVQGLIAVVMLVVLQVLAPEFKAHAAPVAPTVKLPASNAQIFASSATFDGNIRLASVSGKVDSQPDASGQEQTFLYLWLTWDTLRPLPVPFAYRVQAVAADASVAIAPAVISPFTDSYPMTCWKTTEGPLTDRLRVPLPGSGSGDWWADLSVVDPATGQPLNVTVDSASRADHIRLGPFHR
jgi:hypothetical protein